MKRNYLRDITIGREAPRAALRRAPQAYRKSNSAWLQGCNASLSAVWQNQPAINTNATLV
jgi:hypothetical protein